MSVSDCLPKFFAVKRGTGYKVYKNDIYNLPSEVRSNEKTNVVSPCTNLQIECMSFFAGHTGVPDKRTTARKEYGGFYNPCSWTFSGYDMTVHFMTEVRWRHVPILNITSSSNDLLPCGSTLLEAPSHYIRNLEDQHDYDTASIIDSLPPEIPIAMPSSIPIILPSSIPIAIPILPSACMPTPPNVNYPPHIKRLVIADVISRSEACPIMAEPLTHENACMTTCGHVFTKEGIDRWLATPSSKKQCPICKQTCSTC